MNIISIQSHVSYGYVGNKAATFPLQSLGFDVWPVHTVQFSNHTGYGNWQGDVFSALHIQSIMQGLESLNLIKDCHAILSGYIGDKEIGAIIVKMVKRFKAMHPNLIYLCDPVMGDSIGKNCFVKSDIPDLFRTRFLKISDIITPNHFEAEILAGTAITTLQDLQQACAFFHSQGISIVLITSLAIEIPKYTKGCCTFLSVRGGPQRLAISPQPIYSINGTGDLFSAVYLGHFLLTQDPVIALQYAAATTYQVIKATVEAEQQELKIIGHDYGAIDLSSITLIPV